LGLVHSLGISNLRVHHSEHCDQAGGIPASYSEGFWLKSLPTVQLTLQVLTIIGKCQDIISN